MKKIEIITDVSNSTLKRNRTLIKEATASFEGKTITITLALKRKRRSNNQNSYYWAVIIPIWKNLFYEEWGEHYSEKETHEFLKYNCNYVEKLIQETGEVIRLTKSTADNSTTDQEMFHDACRKMALEMFNTVIPLPNEQVNFEI